VIAGFVFRVIQGFKAMTAREGLAPQSTDQRYIFRQNCKKAARILRSGLLFKEESVLLHPAA